MIEEFEVKGPHEELLEGEKASRGFNNKLAVMTAIMATLAAFLSYESSVSLGEAIILKSEASIKKTEAADQWNYFQAKSYKQSIADLAIMLTKGNDQEKSRSNFMKYGSEKTELQKKAEAIDRTAYEANVRSEKYMQAHHRWATGMTTMQIGISLAAMALLTRRKWLVYASMTCAVCGVGFGLFAWLGF